MVPFELLCVGTHDKFKLLKVPFPIAAPGGETAKPNTAPGNDTLCKNRQASLQI